MFRPPGIVLCKSRHDAVDVCPSPTSRRSPISNPQTSNPRRHRSNRATNSPKCLPGWVGGKEKDKHLQKHKLQLFQNRNCNVRRLGTDSIRIYKRLACILWARFFSILRCRVCTPINIGVASRPLNLFQQLADRSSATDRSKQLHKWSSFFLTLIIRDPHLATSHDPVALYLR